MAKVPAEDDTRPTNRNFSWWAHCFKTWNEVFGEELLKIDPVLPKDKAIFREKIVEIGVKLLANSCATLPKQMRPI